MSNISKPLPKVGQTLQLMRVRGVQKLRPVEVTRVGRLYFTVSNDGHYEVEFHIETWREKTDTITSFLLYQSEAEWRDGLEEKELTRKIGLVFEYGKNPHSLSLPVLRRIVELMDLKPSEAGAFPVGTKTNHGEYAGFVIEENDLLHVFKRQGEEDLKLAYIQGIELI